MDCRDKPVIHAKVSGVSEPAIPQIELKPIESLVAYARNARTHSPTQIKQIQASLLEFGWTNPVLADDIGIVAGHGRVMSATELYAQGQQVRFPNGAPIPLGMVPVVDCTGWSPAQRRAYILADNQLALTSGWDEDLLKLELQDLQGEEFDIGLLGFSDADLSDLLSDDAALSLGADPDAAPEPPENPVSVVGDIWALGDHRVMCGDSTSISAVNALLQGKKADMVNTDPPYGINYQSNMRTKSDKFEVLKNDDVILDVTPVIDACSTGWVFIWTTWKVVDKWLENTKGFGFPTNMVIWFKGGGGIGDLKKTFSTDYEMALVFNRGAELCGKRIGSVWQIGKDSPTDYVHPTQKPVELAEEAIEKTSRKGDTVLDLFGGSGSTLIACEKTGRQARLMELDPRYCDVIVKRWQAYSGRAAVHAETGAPFPSEST